MLANHTSIHASFAEQVAQYDKFRNRNAFIDQYKKEAIFKDGLEEFDDSRAVVSALVNEYKASEKPDYLNYGVDQDKNLLPTK